MENRHILSYALFVLAVVLLLVIGLLVNNWPVGIAVALVFVVAGVIFYRRGK